MAPAVAADQGLRFRRAEMHQSQERKGGVRTTRRSGRAIALIAPSSRRFTYGTGGRNIRPASATASVPQLRPIIVVDVFVPVAIRPVPLGVAIIFRRALKLILGNTNSIAAKIGVVLQACPGHRVVVFAHSQEAAE